MTRLPGLRRMNAGRLAVLRLVRPMPRRRPFHASPLPERVVESPDQLSECLEHLRAAPVIGFDTEFVGENSYRPDLCLVQVATAGRLVLIDPLAAGPLDAFWEVLLDPARVVVVHAGREEVRMCHFATGRPPTNVFDVQIAAALVGLPYPIGYGGVVQEVLGARAHKGETLTDWRRRPLTASQVKYAYDDVRFLLPIWERLTDRLRRLDRADWAAEEFAAFVKRSITDDPTVERWRKLKGLGGLSRRELAVVREVFAWRDEVAARLNRPPRVILRDDLLSEIARRSFGHGRPEDLHNLRGVPHRDADAILAAVRRAEALSPHEWPDFAEREIDPPHIATLATLLNVVLAEWCGRMELAPNVVATSADLKSLVRARQPDGRPPNDSALTSGWRAVHVRPYLEAVLDGESVIRVIDPGSHSPLAVYPAGRPLPPTADADSDEG